MEQNRELLKKRRRTFHYRKEQISDAQLHDLEAYGISVQREEQPWFFAVIQNQEILNHMAEMTGLDDPFYGAPTLIAAFAKDNAVSAVVDTAFALSSMMNEAVNEGLGTCMIGSLKDLLNHPEHMDLRNLCRVPDGYTCIGSIAIGFPDEEEDLPDHQNTDVFSYIR